ncbi:MAG: HEPN domain-containing protein [Thermodesulfobium sp.]
MSFDWMKFLDLAKELENNKNEEYIRTSISRKYYGLFCTIRDLIKCEENKKNNVHFVVIKALKTSEKPDEKWIGSLLDSLRRLRNKADYDGKHITEREFDYCIKDADEIKNWVLSQAKK